MEELIPGGIEGNTEKHIPLVKITEDRVIINVGKIDHGMAPEEYIHFVYVETQSGGMVKKLTPPDKPYAEFCKPEDQIKAVYTYCNLHGLWKVVV